MTRYPEKLQPMPTDRCNHITCKGMAVFGEEYLTSRDEVDRSHSFECHKTHNALGPDAALVSLSSCVSGRSCFEEI